MSKSFFYSVVVCLGAFACQAQRTQLGNAPPAPVSSSPAVKALAAASTVSPCWYDTTNRAQIANAYNTSLVPNYSVPMGWTGTFAPPNAGATASAFQAAIFNQLNWVRALAGVPCLTNWNSAESAWDQQAAFMMMTNGALNHNPPGAWVNWTQSGATAASESNLCFGSNGDPGCVQQYMLDTGTGNEAVGHRRWILYPQTTAMGSGDVPGNGGLYQTANALWVIDPSTYSNPRPATRDNFVAWPPPGYVPYRLMPGRWSFSYQGADFSAASVTMTRGAAAVPVTLQPVANAYGENTLVWVPGTDIPAPPNGDTVSTVTVANILIGGAPQTFMYQVITFDPGVAVVPPPTADSVNPNSGSGLSQTFTLNYSSGKGYAALNDVYVLFNGSLTSVAGCAILYDKPSNAFYLYNDTGTAIAGPLTPATGGSLSNSQCTLSGVGSSISGLANTLTMTLNLSLNGSFAGAKTTYMYGADNGGLASNWQTRGTWTIPVASGPPVAVAVSPNSGGSGLSQVFTAVYADPNGAADLSSVNLLFNSALSGPNSCWIYYLRAANQIYLYKDDVSGAVAGFVTPGAAGSISNSQCTVSSGGVIATTANTLSLPVKVTFSGSFVGAKIVYGLANDNEGAGSGWQSLGTWTVSPPLALAASVAPNAGSGSTQLFSSVSTNMNGAADPGAVYIMLNTSINGANACLALYIRTTNLWYLYNDAGSGLVSGSVTAGGAGSIANSQCTLTSGGAAVTSGNTVTVPVMLSFTAGFAGAKNIYGYAQSNGGQSAGWQTLGTWTVTAPLPTAASVTPNSGTGFAQDFTFVYTDSNGGADLNAAYVLVNSTLVVSNGCFALYYRPSNALYLYNDAASALVAGAVTPGSPGSVANSQCALSSGGPVVTSGNTMTVPFTLTFSAGFTGQKNVYGHALSVGGQSAGWQALGTWTPVQLPTATQVTPNAGSGATQIFSFVYTDPSGAVDLTLIRP